MSRYWKAIVTATALLGVCDVASSQKPATHAPETMQIGARVREERVNVRTGPGSDFERTRLVDKEARVTVTAREGEWVQITLPSGASGWVGLKFVDPEKPIVAPKAENPVKPAAVVAKPSVATAPAPTGTPTTKQAAAVAPSQKPAAAAPRVTASHDAVPAGKKPGEVANDFAGALAGTKPDILSGAKEVAATGSGDPFRVLVVLVPLLGGIWLAVRGLKALQQRTGSLPDFRKGVRGAILGGFNINVARKTGGSSLRVLESIPIGTASLHLVEARGRVLLLGASGGTLNTLADLTGGAPEPPEPTEEADFRSVLNAMSDDLADDDLEGGVGMMVGSLEDRIRETREAIARAAVRTGRA